MTKPQSPRTDAADWTRCNFEDQHARSADTTLGVNSARREPDGRRCRGHRPGNPATQLGLRLGHRDINRFLEKRSVQRVGLVEDCECTRRPRVISPSNANSCPSMNDSSSSSSCAASRSDLMSGRASNLRRRSTAPGSWDGSSTRITPRLPESDTGFRTAGNVLRAASAWGLRPTPGRR